MDFVTHFTGAGNFGSVMRGIYSRNGQRIPVAIKTLKQDDVPNAEVSFQSLIFLFVAHKCLPPYDLNLYWCNQPFNQ